MFLKNKGIARLTFKPSFDFGPQFLKVKLDFKTHQHLTNLSALLASLASQSIYSVILEQTFLIQSLIFFSFK